jgi:hypothetical protein
MKEVQGYLKITRLKASNDGNNLNLHLGNAVWVRMVLSLE